MFMPENTMRKVIFQSKMVRLKKFSNVSSFYKLIQIHKQNIRSQQVACNIF